MSTANPDYDVLVIGEINVDLILTGDAKPVFGQTEKLVDDATLAMGASGVIFACGITRLGLRTAYCGVVGDDIFGRFMLENLQARGVDPIGVHVDPALKTGLTVILHHNDDRALLTHLGAINQLRAEQVDRSLFDRVRHIHITSYFLQHALQPGLVDLLVDARQRGVTVSIDTNWDPQEEWNHGLAQVLANCDIFLPNAQEALAIARRPTIPEALETLAAQTPTVAIKLGADGAIARQGDTIVRDPGFRAPQVEIEVVDTTGAGDSFNTGFLYGYLHQWPLADSLALACACGTLSTRAAGGTAAQATLAEAQAFIQQRAQATRQPE